MNDHKATTTIDVRTIEPRYRHQIIFDTFEKLGPGQFLLLVNDHDPAPLHYQFQAEQPDQFNWEYVEQGPEVWKVNIFKKAA